jgi:hypothetical protein
LLDHPLIFFDKQGGLSGVSSKIKPISLIIFDIGKMPDPVFVFEAIDITKRWGRATEEKAYSEGKKENTP